MMNRVHRKIGTNWNKKTNQIEVFDTNTSQAAINVEAWPRKCQQGGQ